MSKLFTSKLTQQGNSFLLPLVCLGQSDLSMKKHNKQVSKTISQGLRNYILLTLTILSSFFSFTTQAQDINLSLSQSVDNTTPNIGDWVNYTLYLKNTGSNTATGITVSDQTPYGAINNVMLIADAGTANYNTGNGLIDWSIDSLIVGDSIKLEIFAQPSIEGVYFNIAEVSAADQNDVNSTPGNNILSEDDIATSCFSVPLIWYPGDEYTVSIPAPYTIGSGITWYKDGLEIDSTTSGVTINPDTTLAISSPGIYTFSTLVGSCPATGCCGIIIYEGPYGSIGDYVWEDTNGNGIQTVGESPITGITVYLLDSASNILDSSLTSISGLYSFDSLTNGNYFVQFSNPSNYVLSPKMMGANSNLDSDIDENTGISDLINIDTSLPLGNIGRTYTNIDAGLIPAFDLALRNTLASAGPILPGANITFNIDVINQGAVTATFVNLVDYVPAGFTLNSANWTMDGDTARYNNQISLLPSDSTTVQITFTIDNNATGVINNIAEISSAKGPGSIDVIDIDSTPDDDPLNDGLALNNEVNESGKNGGDEDDSDFELVLIQDPSPAFDLALIKTANGSGSFAIGDTVTYNLEIINEGNQDANFVNIVDFVPDDLTLIDANWNRIGNSASYIPQLSIAAYGSTNISIRFLINATASNSISNSAEITSAKGPSGEDVTDIDSTPNNNDPNEDDFDSAIINIGSPIQFDLNLSKTLSSSGSFFPGSSITFNIEIANTGDTDATGIQISDYIPTGLILQDNNWTMNLGIATYNLPLSVSSGNNIIVPISFNIDPNVTLGTYENKAEISANFGPIGEAVTDIDSSPDNNPNNDAIDEDDIDTQSYTIEAASSIGNFVWDDLNMDGIQDLNEPGMVDVFVSLETPAGAFVDSVRTDSLGFYTFNYLRAGDYVVIFGKPNGHTASSPNQTTDAQDSDADLVTGESQIISLLAGNSDNTIDAGFYLDNTCYQISSVSASNNQICMGDTTYLSATTNNNSDINWYYTPINGTPVFTTNSGEFAMVFPTTSMTYYAEMASTPLNCPNPRMPVTIVVNARPSKPTCGSLVEICLGNTANLFNYILNGITTPGGVFEWHVSGDPSSALVSNPMSVSDGTYYLFERSGTGCYSTPAMLEIAEKSCDKFIDLSLIKIADQRNVVFNDLVNYTFTIVNAGPDSASNIVIEDVQPDGLEFVSSSDFTFLDGVLTAGIDSLAAYQSVILSYTARVIGSGTIINIAEITSVDQIDLDSTPGNADLVNEDDDDDEIINVINPNPLADLSLQKLVNDNTPGSGDLISYTVSITNAGPDIATNVSAIDILPSGLDYVSSSGGNSNNFEGNMVTAIFNSIGVNQTVQFTVNANVSGIGTITNTAQVSASDQIDPDSTPNAGTTEDDNDSVSIVVTENCNPTTPIISVSNTFICLGASTTLTAVGCNGTVEWSNGQFGNSIVASPTNNTIYTAQCRESTCLSVNSNAISVVVSNPITPTISASKTTICLGETITLSAASCVGTVLWSNGMSGNSINITPAITATYTAICTIASCQSSSSNSLTINVGTEFTPTITASSTSICLGSSVMLTASNCTENIVWNTGDTLASISIIPTVTSTYSVTCGSGACTGTSFQTITVGNIQTPTITASQTQICLGESVILTASACLDGLTWSTGATGNSINVEPSATQTYSVTCGSGSCSATGNLEIVVGSGNTIVLSQSQETICVGESTTLTVSGCLETVNWSNGQTGNSISVSPVTTTLYTATCGSGLCASTGSTTINVNEVQNPNISASLDTICGAVNVTLTITDCSSSIMWSTGETSAEITVSPSVTTSYAVLCGTGFCSGSANKTIVVGFQETPSITASRSFICEGDSVVLTASGCSQSLLWNTGEITSTITVAPIVNTSYSVVCGEACPESNSIEINVLTAPTLSASETLFCAASDVTLSASGCETGMVNWSNGMFGNSIIVSITSDTLFTATCSNGVCTSENSNELSLIIDQPEIPVITSSGNLICAGASINLMATGCIGTVIWSDGSTGEQISVSPLVPTAYSAVCRIEDCTSNSSNILNIDVTNSPTAPVISFDNANICSGDSLVLNGMSCEGIVQWSNGATGSSIIVVPDSTTTYTATCVVGVCESPESSPATIIVGLPEAPVISAIDTVLCYGASTILEAQGCSGTVLWSDGQNGASITVSPDSTRSYTAVCNAGTCQSDTSNSITININGIELVAPSVANLTNTCPMETVSLADAILSSPISVDGSFHFRRYNSIDSLSVSKSDSIYSNGVFYVFEDNGNGCFSSGAQISVNIIPCDTVDCITSPAISIAGVDTSICLSSDYFQLAGQIGGAAGIGTWTTSGSGTFENTTDLNSRYYYSASDISDSSLVITLTTNDPDGDSSCVAASSNFSLNIDGIAIIPTINSNKSPIICVGDSVILSANEDAFAYFWNTGDTTKNITVTTPGTYIVKLINESGCSSLSSDPFEVSNMGGIVGPLVNDLATNVCPVNTVNLNDQILSEPSTDGGSFEFHTGISPDSPLLDNVIAMPAGDYYAYEKSALGCYSIPSLIKVTIEECELDTSSAELSIQIVGNASTAAVGDEIIFTITVFNNGPNEATNVLIENTIPSGLNVLNETPGLTAGEGKLSTTIPSLTVGSSETFVYTAQVTESNGITNYTEIVSADQVDPLLSNNSSLFNISCAECQDICIATSLAADTLKLEDGSYEVTFTALIKNCGGSELTGVGLSVDLDDMFGNTATYTLMQQPELNEGSDLSTNIAFNGSSEIKILKKSGSELAASVTDTIVWKINLMPNGTEGPYSVNSLATGIGTDEMDVPTEVSDLSNDGLYINAPSETPTVISLFKTPSIGLSLAIVDTVSLPDGSMNITFLALVKNNGALDLSNVIITDSLNNTFPSPDSFFVVGTPMLNDGSDLIPNNTFDGKEDNQLTLDSSFLAIGETQRILFVVNAILGDQKIVINQAIATANGVIAGGGTQMVMDISNVGYNPDTPGEEPTIIDLEEDEGNTQSIQAPCIGLSLYVADSTKLPDGSFDITYHALVSNCGNVNLSQITLCDSLMADFPAPSVVSLKTKPSLGYGSNFMLDPSFDGINNTCMLEPSNSSLAIAQTDTIKWTINLTLNSNNGPFLSNVTATGKSAADENVIDISNDGINPAPEGESPTVLNFNNLSADIIGIAKELVSIEHVNDNVYDVIFKFYLKNYGVLDFSGVQIQDNIAETYGNLVSIDSVRIFDVSPGLTANPNYTGKGNLINLLTDFNSTLPRSSSGTVSLLTRVDLSKADTTIFENMALAIGYQNGSSTDDQSNIGNNPDPDSDGTPENNSIPTPIDFGPYLVNPAFETPLGIAKSVSDTTRVADGSYHITYTVVVKNYGTATLTNIQLSDTLSDVFGDNYTSFAMVGQASIADGTSLALNSAFDGVSDVNFLIQNNSTLTAGASDTLTFTVKVRNNSNQSVTYSNSIFGEANLGLEIVTDISNTGLNPDDDGDNNPGNNNNATVLNLPSGSNNLPTNVSVLIPGGISPNDDGLNDKLVIEGVSVNDSLIFKIYNRWGSLVFETDNYIQLYPGSTDGWNGKANTGVRFSKEETQLPDGTYFYYTESHNSELFQGKPYFNFITISGGRRE